MAAFAPPALKRLAKFADGWNPVAIPLDGMAQMFESIKQMAKDAGRDPSRIELVIRAHTEITDRPLGKERSIFSGSSDQIKEDMSPDAAVLVPTKFTLIPRLWREASPWTVGSQ